MCLGEADSTPAQSRDVRRPCLRMSAKALDIVVQVVADDQQYVGFLGGRLPKTYRKDTGRRPRSEMGFSRLGSFRFVREESGKDPFRYRGQRGSHSPIVRTDYSNQIQLGEDQDELTSRAAAGDAVECPVADLHVVGGTRSSRRMSLVHWSGVGWSLSSQRIPG